ncbi:MAG TPA: hypothetical protein VH596_06920 [Terriglobales bacterium]
MKPPYAVGVPDCCAVPTELGHVCLTYPRLEFTLSEAEGPWAIYIPPLRGWGAEIIPDLPMSSRTWLKAGRGI